jgi:hypothetical protein
LYTNDKGVDITIPVSLYSNFSSMFHTEDFSGSTFKWVSDSGHEFVINRDGEFETRPEYIGTYNWGQSGIAHTVLDIIPYARWGNSPDDGTPFLPRAYTSYLDYSTKRMMNKFFN